MTDDREKLTKNERAILSLLHEILAKVEPAHKKYHDNAVQILRDGYYELWLDESIGHYSDPMAREEMAYVHDVLDMYSYIQYSYKDLTPTEKKQLKKDNVKFGGFDGNNETNYLAYTRFLIEKMERWTDLDYVRDLNTHFPTRRMYERMLSKLPPREYGKRLSSDEIKSILSRE